MDRKRGTEKMIMILFTDGTSQEFNTAKDAYTALQFEGGHPSNFRSWKSYLESTKRENEKDLPRIVKFKKAYGIESYTVTKKKNPNPAGSGVEKPRILSNDPYHDLAMAVIQQAVMDYKNGIISTQTFLEFCKSPWFELLADGQFDGMWVFNNVKEKRKKGFE